jgi:type I restriction enzyme S subunit
MRGDRQQLPQGWVETTLSNVQLDIGRGVEPSRTPDETFELYSVPSHEHGAPEVIKGIDIGSNKRTIEPHTVLLCKINPRINRVWVTGNNSPHRKIASTEWIPFFPIPGLEPRYLAYFLRQDKVRNFLAGNASGVGGSLMRVRAATFRDFSFSLAPLPEQIRIADGLDELFSDLDAGVAALERVRDKLKLYRASVLKAAVEGTLTAEWRQQHPGVETAPELLKRILAEGRRLWEEEQLRQFKEKGQEPPKNWKVKYKEPVAPNTLNLSRLPEGWCWASMDQIGETQGGLQKSPNRKPIKNHYPYLRVANVLRGSLDLRELHRFELTNGELERLRLCPGDLLIVEGNGSRTQIGRCAMWSGELDNCVHQNHIIRVRPLPGLIPKYINLFLNSPAGQNAIQSVASSTSGLYTLSVSKIEKLPVALPPTKEQESIVDAVEEQLSVIDHLEMDLDTKVMSSQGVRQSILRHAFTGQLTLQDPDDEPASELLKRIAAEREESVREAAVAKQAKKQSPKLDAGEKPRATKSTKNRGL